MLYDGSQMTSALLFSHLLGLGVLLREWQSHSASSYSSAQAGVI